MKTLFLDAAAAAAAGAAVGAAAGAAAAASAGRLLLPWTLLPRTW